MSNDGVSLGRLYGLRALYLFVVVGLGAFVWPGLLDPATRFSVLEGQTTCMLAAFSLLCLVGLRYPLQMLPVLLWEILWKTMWLAIVPLPQWLSGHLDAKLGPAVFACSMVVLVYLAVPWDYVARQAVGMRGARWR